MTSTASTRLAESSASTDTPANQAQQTDGSTGADRRLDPLEVFSAEMETRVHELVVGQRRDGLSDPPTTRPARPTTQGAP